MNDFLIISKEDADLISGSHGTNSAIVPIPCPDGRYYISNNYKNDPDLSDIASVLESLTGTTMDIQYLPDVGQPVIAGQIYHYTSVDDYIHNGYVIAVQSHTRMHYPPQDTPALFTFFREYSDMLEWIPNEKVYIGWKRVYSGVSYVVLMDHMTQSDWTPPQTLGILWAVDGGGSGDWSPGVAYVVNQEVTYDGHTYKCLQAHTSQIGWEPPNVPALWEFIS